jgi:hypothetical protein
MSRDGDPKALSEAKALWADAKVLETKIEKAADSIGRPGLADEMRAARKQIAQSYVIDNALDHNGNLSAAVLGRMLDNGVPLTDQLRLIAKFEQTAGGVMKEAAKAPSAIPDALRFATGMGTAAMGAGTAFASKGVSPAMLGGAVAGMAVPYATQFAAKKIMFNPAYQRTMLTPNALLASVDQPDLLAQFARFSTATAGREPNSFLVSLQERFPRKPPEGANQFLRTFPQPQRAAQPRPAPVQAASMEIAPPQMAAPPPEPAPATVAVAAPPMPQFVEGKIYEDPRTGIRKRYVNGQFVNP